MSRGIKVSSTSMRRERKIRAWSQAKLAQKAGVSLGTVSRIEQGHAATPDVIGKLADALGVAPSRLTAPTENTGEALLALVEGKTGELRQAIEADEVTTEMAQRAEWMHRDIERYAGPLIANGPVDQAMDDLWSAVVEAYQVSVQLVANRLGSVENLPTRRERSQRGREEKTA